MVLPFLAGAGGAMGGIIGAAAVGAPILDNALGRPFDLWTNQVNAENAAELRDSGYKGNFRRANALPSPDAIYSAYRRGLLTNQSAAAALLSWGVRPTRSMIAGSNPALRRLLRENDRLADHTSVFLSNLWSNVAYVGMQRPSAPQLASMVAHGRMTESQWDRLSHGIDADWRMFLTVAENSYQSPDFGTLLQLRRMGRISAADYALWSNRAGWTNVAARNVLRNASTLPTLGEAFIASWRGIISPEQLRQYGYGFGYVNAQDWAIVSGVNRPMPGPSDLVRFAVRDVWDHETALEWGYDADFPPELQAFLKWQGLDWGESVRRPDGTMTPVVSWPQAYWRSHWQLMSPSQAYMAFRMLRPNRLRRYRHLAADVTPFTAADLARTLKVSDYPPKMRAWLAAISGVAMSTATLRNGLLRGTIPFAEVGEQLMDRGHTPEDAIAIRDTWQAQEDYRLAAPVRAFHARLHTQAFAEATAAYKEGAIDRTAFGTRLLALGASNADAQRAAALADSQNAREELREALTALRRAWLQGAIAPAQLAPSLQRLGLSAESTQRYLRRWVRQRSLTRRMLSTGQVQRGLAEGAITPALASIALENLGWNAADTAFLLSESVAKAAQRSARDSLRVAAQVKASQREKVRALQQAQAASRQLRAQLRSSTSLTTLRQWFLSGVRTGQWIHDRLALMGFDTSSIQGHLSQWAIEGERAPHTEAPVVEGREKLARRQTSRATVKAWWQNGVVTDQWARQRLQALGYDHGTVERYILEWRATLGKKPGPAKETILVPATPEPRQPHGPQALHTQARPVHQTPGRAGASP